MCLPNNTNDFDLIERAFIQVAEKKKKFGIAALSPHEQTVYFVWAALGILENGSFQYFYENGMRGDEVANSLDVLDLKPIAKHFRRADQILSEGSTENWKEQLAYLEMRESEFDLLAREILRDESEIEKKLATYIRSCLTA